MRILYAGDVLPQDSTSSSKIVYRHLSLLALRHDVFIAHWDECPVPGVRSIRLPLRRWFRRCLASTRRRHFEALDGMMGLRVRDQSLQAVVCETRPDVLLTIAHGGLCQNALRVGERNGLPLVSFFHDWFYDWRRCPRWARGGSSWAFRHLYRKCAAALCISAAMRESLGAHPCAYVLPPIPTIGAISALRPSGVEAPMMYAGVLNGFCETEVRQLAAQWRQAPHARVPLRFFGPNPYWGDEDGSAILNGGLYGGFVDEDDLARALGAARFLLVIMPFGKPYCRFSRCSFPSKLSQYCAVGRPIVIWAPAASSAVGWAKDTGAALCVTIRDPAAVQEAVETLAGDQAAQDRLSAAARHEYRVRFDPDLLQRRFEDILAATSARKRP